MAKVQIAAVGVYELEYRGENTPMLECGYRYAAVIIEGISDDGTITRINFLPWDKNDEYEIPGQVIYDSTVSFAKDWQIIKEIMFEEPFNPPKKA